MFLCMIIMVILLNVMKYGGTIYNLGGPATDSYGKELALIAKKAYKFIINLL